MATQDIFQPGRNCWRVERAGRAAFLVDGQEYFSAFRAAAKQARHSIFIIGWDINSRMRLRCDESGGPPDDLPDGLLDFLKALLSRRHSLRVYVLGWDFAMLYALDREWLPMYKPDWRSQRHLHFYLDDRHPVGASQHQKIVAIDDAVAFVGGLDLTKSRWDTRAHRPDDPRRKGADGKAYPPFHDAQMMVDGDAAAAVGRIARERWRHATGQRLEAAHDIETDPWPREVSPVLRGVDVAISRTVPPYNGNTPVQEIKHLYLDAIAAARRRIYLENQYFTSPIIGEALARRLAEPDGPEIVFIGPLQSDGWLSQRTMDILRARLLQNLRQYDRFGRLRSYYPDIEGLDGMSINVHSKLAVIDDDLLIIGSANLNNRSLGVDSECNLALAARGEARVARAIAEFRNGLIAEHLGWPREHVTQALEKSASLIAVTQIPGAGGHSLRALDRVLSPELDDLVPDGEILDPERPVSMEQLVAQLVPEEEQTSLHRRLFILLSIFTPLLGLAAAWRWSPLGQWLNVENLAEFIGAFNGDATAPWLLLGGYVVGGLLVVPITLLIVVTVMAFGPVKGAVYSLIGALLSAALVFGIGHLLGRGKVRRLAGSHINRLSQRLARQGILTIVILRLLPIAPYTIVNLVFGTSHIRLRDFMLGTALGMAPGIIAIAFFVDSVQSALIEPKPASFMILAGAIGAIVLATFGLRRWLSQRDGSVRMAAAPKP